MVQNTKIVLLVILTIMASVSGTMTVVSEKIESLEAQNANKQREITSLKVQLERVKKEQKTVIVKMQKPEPDKISENQKRQADALITKKRECGYWQLQEDSAAKRTNMAYWCKGLYVQPTRSIASKEYDQEKRDLAVRKARWEYTCNNDKNAWQYVECWKEPGAVKRVYEYTGATREQLIEKAKKSIEVKRLNHNFKNRKL